MGLVFFYDEKTLTGAVRGKQIADYLGALSNPEEINGLDTLISIKKSIPITLKDRTEIVYFEAGDDLNALENAALFSLRVRFIVNNMSQKKFIESRFGNPCYIIPHHHCNFGNDLRSLDRPVKNVGYVGSRLEFDFNFELIKCAMLRQGLTFFTLFSDIPSDCSREDVCHFYKNIDIQISFRSFKYHAHRNPQAGCSLKVANASSFGIPTICWPEPAYIEEFSGCFLPAMSIGELCEVCWQLKGDQGLYKLISERCIEKAKPYHISNVAKLFKQLERAT